MVSFKSLPVLVLGVFAATSFAAPLQEDVAVELAARDNDTPQWYNGRVWWSQFQGTTACNYTYNGNDADKQYLGAVRGALWDKGSICGKNITVQFDNVPNKQIEVTIIDTCSGCDLILSKAPFQVSKPVAAGVTSARWMLSDDE